MTTDPTPTDVASARAEGAWTRPRRPNGTDRYIAARLSGRPDMGRLPTSQEARRAWRCERLALAEGR